MGGWWVHELYQAGRTVELISWTFWVVFSICLHELAHGWAALWQGDDTPRRLGRMTLNPLVHMGPMSLLMFALVGIAWGVMPTDPSRYRMRRKGRFFVAGAGPAMNILLALIALTSVSFWIVYGPQTQPVQENVRTFLLTGGWLNLFLAAFNLLPIPPLDGANVLAGLSYRFYVLYQNPQAMMVGMFIMIVLLMSGIGGAVFFGTSLALAHGYVTALSRLLTGGP